MREGVGFLFGCVFGLFIGALISTTVKEPAHRLRGAREALGAPSSAQIVEVDGADYLVWTEAGVMRSHKLEAGR